LRHPPDSQHSATSRALYTSQSIAASAWSPPLIETSSPEIATYSRSRAPLGGHYRDRRHILRGWKAWYPWQHADRRALRSEVRQAASCDPVCDRMQSGACWAGSFRGPGSVVL